MPALPVIAALLCLFAARQVPPAPAPAPDPPDPPEPRVAFETIAALELPHADRFPGNHAFRAVALRMPFAYVLSRMGDLYIFKVPELPERPAAHTALRVLQQAGDGNDLLVVDDTLMLCRWGHLEVYSLEDPAQPQHLGRFGPENQHFPSQAMIRDGDVLFVVGAGGIGSYDISKAAEPRLIGQAAPEGHGMTGCVISDRLYVGELGTRKGIGIYDISDPAEITATGFVETRRGPYHVFALSGQRILASLDADSLVHSGRDVHGNSAMFDVSEPDQPALIGEWPKSGGRAAALLTADDKEYFICHGAVFSIEERELGERYVYEQMWSKGNGYASGGSTLDGAPYHGDAQDRYTALALDDVALVIMRQVEVGER